jgi:hypothetical protein
MQYFENIKHLCAAVIFSLVSATPIAANTDSNIITLAQGQNSPKAKIMDVSWIAGYWQGEIWGGQFEEVWSQPSAGSMMASFKYMEDDTVGFYEIITLVEEGDSLMLRLKHFSPDLTGWEKEDETVDFRLAKLTPNAVYFDGYTFKRINENEMHVFVLVDNDGKSQETQFIFKRNNK